MGDKERTSWRPIRTAPRDGRLVDLFALSFPSPGSHSMKGFSRLIDCRWRDGIWVQLHDGQEHELHGIFVTHWMFPPKPPKET